MMCTLPPDVLELVLLHVAYSLEVDGVRGPTIVVHDLVVASSTCTALRRSIGPALEYVVSQFDTSPFDWDRVMRAPTTFKLTDLREIARDVGVHVSGTKTVISTNILDAFDISKRRKRRVYWSVPRRHHAVASEHEGVIATRTAQGGLVTPSIFPPTLLRVLHIEQTTSRYMPSDDVVYMYDFVARHTSLRRVSRLVPASVFRSIVHESFESTAHLETKMRELRQYTCACGNKAAVHCMQKSCVRCCLDRGCTRHMMGFSYYRKTKIRRLV